MADCYCVVSPLNHNDYERELIGIDQTHGRFGEVSIMRCQVCGRTWLNYSLDYEGYERSGRWYRGLVTAEQLAGLKPEQATDLLARCPWYIYGGSYFRSTGQIGSGPLVLV